MQQNQYFLYTKFRLFFGGMGFKFPQKIITYIQYDFYFRLSYWDMRCLYVVQMIRS